MHPLLIFLGFVAAGVLLYQIVSYLTSCNTYGSHEKIFTYQLTLDRLNKIDQAITKNDHTPINLCTKYLTLVDTAQDLQRAMKQHRYETAYNIHREIEHDVIALHNRLVA